MNKIKVAILFGGMSTEHEVSCKSACFVINNIDREKYDVVLFGITKQGQWYKYLGDTDKIMDATWTDCVSKEKIPFNAYQFIKEINNIDIVFPVLHGKNGEDGSVQGFLTVLDIPYVGCGIAASAGCMDKAFAKAVFDCEDIPQGEYVVALKNDIENKPDEVILKCEEKIGYPCFVKPANAGSSVGVSKAYDKEQLKVALLEALKYDGRILIEEFMKGTEVECSIMGNEQPLASGTGKIVAGSDFYDYNAKYINNNSLVLIPSGLDKELEDKIKVYALKAYKAMDCSGLSRVDFFVDEERLEAYINEINTLPGCTSISMYPKLWEKEGIKGDELISRLIEYGLDRYNYMKNFKVDY